MATLDQLQPDRRAVIELVLSRGQSYAELAETLGMTEPRVREYAREALDALAPRSAENVDPQWRGQIADYVLGQQTGPEAKATRSHMRSSEAARTWAVSVMDSIGHLYPNGAEPHIPGAGRGEPAAPAERRGAEATAPAAAAAAAGNGSEATSAPARRTRPAGPLSPEARAVVRRRRIVGAIAALVVVAGLVVLATQVLGGDDDAATSETETAADGGQELLLQSQLQPVGGTRGSGAAVVFSQGDQTAVLARGRLPSPDRGQTYGAWLFNSRSDAVAIPTQTDPRGNVQAFGPVEDPDAYQFVDISLQEEGNSRRHSGDSVLRGPLAPAENPTGDEVPAPEAP